MRFSDWVQEIECHELNVKSETGTGSTRLNVPTVTLLLETFLSLIILLCLLGAASTDHSWASDHEISNFASLYVQFSKRLIVFVIYLFRNVLIS